MRKIYELIPPLKEYMYEKPKKKDENIINRYMKDEIIFTGLFSALMCVFFLKSLLSIKAVDFVARSDILF